MIQYIGMKTWVMSITGRNISHTKNPESSADLVVSRVPRRRANPALIKPTTRISVKVTNPDVMET